MMHYDNYSVLMSVYYKEKAEYLQQALDSIFNQTILTNDFVLVCDGKLTESLNEVIEKTRKKYPVILHIIRLDQNQGLGNALNIGIKYCKNELVARMDSDDISYPDRCERQIKIFNNMDNVSIVSGTVEEFSSDINIVDSKRVLPENNKNIREFAKSRNPFNHPCVMYKKSHVEEAGGYKDFYLLEDYYLWIRMLLKGFEGYNIQDPLLYMRAGSDMYKRRSGLRYLQSQKKLFKYMKEIEFITFTEYSINIVMRMLSSMAPNTIRKMMFERILRK